MEKYLVIVLVCIVTVYCAEEDAMVERNKRQDDMLPTYRELDLTFEKKNGECRVLRVGGGGEPGTRYCYRRMLLGQDNADEETWDLIEENCGELPVYYLQQTECTEVSNLAWCREERITTTVCSKYHTYCCKRFIWCTRRCETCSAYETRVEYRTICG